MDLVIAFDELAETLANIAPPKFLNLRSPKNMSERVDNLVAKKKEGEISETEAIELERYLTIDLLISLTKAHAKKILT